MQNSGPASVVITTTPHQSGCSFSFNENFNFNIPCNNITMDGTVSVTETNTGPPSGSVVIVNNGTTCSPDFAFSFTFDIPCPVENASASATATGGTATVTVSNTGTNCNPNWLFNFIFGFGGSSGNTEDTVLVLGVLLTPSSCGISSNSIFMNITWPLTINGTPVSSINPVNLVPYFATGYLPSGENVTAVYRKDLNQFIQISGGMQTAVGTLTTNLAAGGFAQATVVTYPEPVTVHSIDGTAAPTGTKLDLIWSLTDCEWQVKPVVPNILCGTLNAALTSNGTATMTVDSSKFTSKDGKCTAGGLPTSITVREAVGCAPSGAYICASRISNSYGCEWIALAQKCGNGGC